MSDEYGDNSMGQSQKTVSVISPCYNEGEGLNAFLDALRDLAATCQDYAFEFVLVDDGSRDKTSEIMRVNAATDPRVRVVRLSRNFGHQRAITAGLDFCQGDYIVVLDSDLQDPPEVIVDILAKLEEGYDLVHTVRADRTVDSCFKRASAGAFYLFMRTWVLPELPVNAGDYKGFNRRVLYALSQYRERVRFLRGAFATLGFRQAEITFTRNPREAGRSKYPLGKMVRFARDAIVSNSSIPLRVLFYVGMVSCAGAGLVALVGLAALGGAMTLGEPVATAVLGVMLFLCGCILMGLGIVGEYLKCIVLESKMRPLYIVESVRNIPAHPLNELPRAPEVEHFHRDV